MSYRDKDFKIIEKRQLTDESFVLRFDRHEMDFQPGQHILVGKDGNYETREYSIYSGVNEDFLEVLVKEVDDGIVSRQLHKLQLGDPIQVEGAVGFFKIKQEDLDKKFLLSPAAQASLLFIALLNLILTSITKFCTEYVSKTKHTKKITTQKTATSLVYPREKGAISMEG